MVKRHYIAMLALMACFLALAVIGLGAFTRLVDAGLGCPDWPGCYGHLTVPITEQARHLISLYYPGTQFDHYKAWAEMIHRYFAGCLSLIILVIVFLIFKNNNKKSNIILAISMLFLIAYQIVLGQWTVTLKLLPTIVTQHLLGGFLILATLWLIYLNNRPVANSLVLKNSKNLLIAAVIALLILLVQITLGAWTSTHYAALSCQDFPFCMNHQPWQPMYFKEAFAIFSPVGINYDGGILAESVRQTIQMTHRLGALIFSIYMIGFAVFILPRLKNAFELTRLIYMILALLFVQLCIGIINVIFKLPLISALAHNLIAALLLLSVITLVFKLATVTKKVSL